jgi:predicted Zn-dependent peptidase
MRATLALVGLLVGLVTTPTPAWSASPDPGTHRPLVSVLTHKKAVLSSGVRVVMNVDRSSPVLASCLVLRAGSAHEGLGGAGLASLAARVASGDGVDYASRAGTVIASRGGKVSVEVGADATSHCITVPANELPVAMWGHAGYLAATIPNDATLGRILHRLGDDSRRQAEVEPYETAWARLQQLSYQGLLPYEYPALISAALADKRGLAHLGRFLDQYYVPQRAVLAIVGDFDQSRALELADVEFGRRSLRAASGYPEPAPGKLAAHTSPRYTMIQSEHAPHVAMFFGWVGPEGLGADPAAFELAATLLGAGPSSRLGQELTQKHSWAREVDAWLERRDGPSLLAIRLLLADRVDPTRIEKVIENKVTELMGAGPRPHELSLARERLRANLLREIDSGVRRAHLLGLCEAVFGDAKLLQRRFPAYASVTPDDVRRVARAYLRPWQQSEVEVYPPNALIEPSTPRMKRYHIVRGGDTLIGIARKYGVSVRDLLRGNKIRRKSPIFPGQKLEVPRGGPAKKRLRKYTVKKGDSLIAIAKRHKVTVNAITRANGINKKKPIFPGQQLVIPTP